MDRRLDLRGFEADGSGVWDKGGRPMIDAFRGPGVRPCCCFEPRAGVLACNDPNDFDELNPIVELDVNSRLGPG
jgi:hypothetical protein